MRGALVVVGFAACGSPARPPPATPCQQAAAAIIAAIPNDADGAEVPLAPIAAADARSCTDEHWSTDAIECFRAAEHESDLELCRTSLSPAQQEAWSTAVLRAIDPDVFAPDTGVDACDDYLRRFDIFVRCGHLSEASRAAAVRALAPRLGAWRMVRDPMAPEARRRMVENECEQGLARLRSSAAELRCTIE